jgi:hypothetical protein
MGFTRVARRAGHALEASAATTNAPNAPTIYVGSNSERRTRFACSTLASAIAIALAREYCPMRLRESALPVRPLGAVEADARRAVRPVAESFIPR